MLCVIQLSVCAHPASPADNEPNQTHIHHLLDADPRMCAHEQLGPVAPSDAHELLFAARVEAQVGRHVVHAPVEGGPGVGGGVVLERSEVGRGCACT